MTECPLCYEYKQPYYSDNIGCTNYKSICKDCIPKITTNNCPFCREIHHERIINPEENDDIILDYSYESYDNISNAAQRARGYSNNNEINHNYNWLDYNYELYNNISNPAQRARVRFSNNNEINHNLNNELYNNINISYDIPSAVQRARRNRNHNEMNHNEINHNLINEFYENVNISYDIPNALQRARANRNNSQTRNDFINVNRDNYNINSTNIIIMDYLRSRNEFTNVNEILSILNDDTYNNRIIHNFFNEITS